MFLIVYFWEMFEMILCGYYLVSELLLYLYLYPDIGSGLEDVSSQVGC